MHRPYLIVQNHSSIRILLTGGGTGGHVFPLLAVVDQLRELEPGCIFHWFGSRRMEAELVPQAGIAGTFIPFTFSYRRLSLRALGYYLRIIPTWLFGIPVWRALGVLLRYKPHVVLSSGGYVSIPMLIAAGINGVPVAIIENNGVPGRVTQWWAPFTKRIYCATEDIERQIQRASGSRRMVTGFLAPVPSLNADDARKHFGIPAGMPLLVVQGGSTGAAAVNGVVDEMLRDVAFAAEYGSHLAILHQRGARSYEIPPEVQRLWPHYRSVDFNKDLNSAYYAASLYFGRSGAATIGELVAAKLPALLMPYPLHADRQQFLNAEALTNINAAEVVEEGSAGACARLKAQIVECIFGGKGTTKKAAYSQLSADGARKIAKDLLSTFSPARNR
jgi:UDP-N-acetylglucosamine--N-acetylmuramyl-(pentapeptide) pyrophosphoryl-undecaprenol N-acetylglucosamine transferase